MSCNGLPRFEYEQTPLAVPLAVGGRWYHVLLVGTTQADLQTAIAAVKSAGGQLRSGNRHCFQNGFALPSLVRFTSDTDTNAIRASLPLGSFAYITTANGGLGPRGAPSSIAGAVATAGGARLDVGLNNASNAADSAATAVSEFGSDAGNIFKIALAIVAALALSSLLKAAKK